MFGKNIKNVKSFLNVDERSVCEKWLVLQYYMSNKNEEKEQILQNTYNAFDGLELCQNVRCSKHERCVVKNSHEAICIRNRKHKVKNKKKKEVEKIKHCKRCPVVVSSSFVCGSDNQTYSSICRLEYFNCVHKTSSKVQCKEFCPCSSPTDLKMKNKKKEKVTRWSGILDKYQATVSKNKSQRKVHKHKTSKFSYGKNEYKKPHKKVDNEILKKEKPSKTLNSVKECTKKDLKIMGNRLLDWFSVIKSNSNIHTKLNETSSHKKRTKFPRCLTEVRWMFEYLDKNEDENLSLKELYSLEHDEHEHCIKPFLDKCDSNKDIFLQPYEWCKCFDKTERPCAAMRSRARGLLGAYIPDCDEHGFFKSTQCHSSVGMCWCVDKHGVEYANSRSRGYKDCDLIIGKKSHEDEDEDENEDDDDSDDDFIEGSGSNYRMPS
ncbi:Proteoglycan Cow [Nymphon striatum]|nr:Proteoglycan Cow [Nymphon striatum]